MVSEQKTQETTRDGLIYYFDRLKSLRIKYHEADAFQAEGVSKEMVAVTLAFANFLEASLEVVELLKVEE